MRGVGTVLVTAGVLWLLAKGDSVQPAVLKTEKQRRMRSLIARVAVELNVPVDVALAFAWLESRFNPDAEGDLQWPELHPDRYRTLVLEGARFEQNPWRTDPRRWHSYGLFQLLAPHHALPHEDPRALLDPELNARRGVTYIKALLKKYGDADRARLAYAGALKLAPSTQEVLLGRLHQALVQFENVA